MKTYQCKNCGQYFWDYEVKCPHCGALTAPSMKKPFYKQWWIWVVAVVLFAAVLGNLVEVEDSGGAGGYTIVWNTAHNETTEPTESYIEISAADLYAAYEENVVAADAKYENQKLKVTGTIVNIGKDILDDTYITLDTGEYLYSIQCYFLDSELDDVATLKKGDTVTLIGTCAGQAIANVILKRCELQK